MLKVLYIRKSKRVGVCDSELLNPYDTNIDLINFRCPIPIAWLNLGTNIQNQQWQNQYKVQAQGLTYQQHSISQGMQQSNIFNNPQWKYTKPGPGKI